MSGLASIFGGAEYTTLASDKTLKKTSPKVWIAAPPSGTNKFILPSAGSYSRSGAMFLIVNTGAVAVPVQTNAALEPGDLGAGAGFGTTYTFGAVGDFGGTTSNYVAVADLIKSWTPDAVLGLGDANYVDDGASVATYNNILNTLYSGYLINSMAANKLWLCPGNHDWGNVVPGSLDAYRQVAVPRGPSYYTFTRGPVQFFMLDSDANEPAGRSSTSVQAKWFKEAIQASRARWKIVAFHHPPFTSGSSHGPTSAMAWPFEAWGAHAVLSGHNHNYERLQIGGIPYFVVGTGGRTLNGFGTVRNGSRYRNSSVFGALKIVANNQTLQFRYFSVAPTELDTLIIGDKSEVTGSPATVSIPTGHMGVFVLAQLCGGGFGWKMALRPAGGPVNYYSKPGHTPVCLEDPYPVYPPPPPEECPVVFYNTGQDTQAITGGVEDLRWNIDGVSCKIPTITPGAWAGAGAYPDAKWVADTFNSASPGSGEAADVERVFYTQVQINADPEDYPLRGQYSVDNKLLGVRVNGGPLITRFAYTADEYGYRALRDFEITSDDGLVEGTNELEWVTEQTGYPTAEYPSNPRGLFVRFSPCVPVTPRCKVVAANTGQVKETDTPCNTDLKWTVNGNPARITQHIDGWVSNQDDAKWVSSNCDTSDDPDTAGTIREFETEVIILGDDVDVVTGRFASDNKVVSLTVNGVENVLGSPIGGIGSLHAFTLTRALGLVTGSNEVIFHVKNTGEDTPWGLLVKFDDACPEMPVGGSAPGDLSDCPLSKVVTVAGATGDFVDFNGVHVVTRLPSDNYWRKDLPGGFTIDLTRVASYNLADPTDRWQVWLKRGTSTMEQLLYTLDSNENCPGNDTYTCRADAATRPPCIGGMTVAVSD